MNYKAIKNRFDRYKLAVELYAVSPKWKGVIVGILEKACGGKENRYLFSKALTGELSSKSWEDGDWYAMEKLVAPVKNAAGHWCSATPNFEQIVRLVLEQTATQEGQESFA